MVTTLTSQSREPVRWAIRDSVYSVAPALHRSYMFGRSNETLSSIRLIRGAGIGRQYI